MNTSLYYERPSSRLQGDFGFGMRRSLSRGAGLNPQPSMPFGFERKSYDMTYPSIRGERFGRRFSVYEPEVLSSFRNAEYSPRNEMSSSAYYSRPATSLGSYRNATPVPNSYRYHGQGPSILNSHTDKRPSYSTEERLRQDPRLTSSTYSYSTSAKPPSFSASRYKTLDYEPRTDRGSTSYLSPSYSTRPKSSLENGDDTSKRRSLLKSARDETSIDAPTAALPPQSNGNISNREMVNTIRKMYPRDSFDARASRSERQKALKPDHDEKYAALRQQYLSQQQPRDNASTHRRSYSTTSPYEPSVNAAQHELQVDATTPDKASSIDYTDLIARLDALDADLKTAPAPRKSFVQKIPKITFNVDLEKEIIKDVPSKKGDDMNLKTTQKLKEVAKPSLAYTQHTEKLSPSNKILQNGGSPKLVPKISIYMPTEQTNISINGVNTKPEKIANGVYKIVDDNLESGDAKSNGLRGLANLGNTCFMNSIIQVLNNTKPLLDYMLADLYVKDINPSSPLKGELIKEFGQIINEMWGTSNNSTKFSIRPVNLKKKVESYAPSFAGYNQQDSQEFLAYLLNGFHDDLNQATQKTNSKRMSIESVKELSAEVSWKKYQETNESKIVDIFGGQLESILKCDICHNKSLAYDPFWSLSVSVSSEITSPNIYDCLNNLFKEEKLDGDNKPLCSKCGKPQPATKCFTIQRFPKILIIHLKRFAAQSRGNYESYIKIRTAVEFPFRGLDMRQYSHSLDANRTTDIYDLYAMTCHTGSISSGHYFSYCKHPINGEWHLFEDSKVEPASESTMDCNNAYLLFYRKRSEGN